MPRLHELFQNIEEKKKNTSHLILLRQYYTIKAKTHKNNSRKENRLKSLVNTHTKFSTKYQQTKSSKTQKGSDTMLGIYPRNEMLVQHRKMNLIYHNDRIKGKDHMIIFIKHLQNPTHYHDKNTLQTQNTRQLPHTDKLHSEKPTANITLSGEICRTSPLSTEDKDDGCSLYIFSTLARENRQDKKTPSMLKRKK